VDSLASYAPLSAAHLDDLLQGSVEDNCPDFTRIADCVTKQRPDFLVVNPSQEAYGRIYYGLEPKWTDRIVKQLAASGRYRVVFDQNRSRVLASTAIRTPASTMDE
jgi:hypothetical protein